MGKKERDHYKLVVKRPVKHANVKFVPGITYTVKPHIYEAIKDSVAYVIDE